VTVRSLPTIHYTLLASRALNRNDQIRTNDQGLIENARRTSTGTVVKPQPLLLFSCRHPEKTSIQSGSVRNIGTGKLLSRMILPVPFSGIPSTVRKPRKSHFFILYFYTHRRYTGDSTSHLASVSYFFSCLAIRNALFRSAKSLMNQSDFCSTAGRIVTPPYPINVSDPPGHRVSISVAPSPHMTMFCKPARNAKRGSAPPAYSLGAYGSLQRLARGP